ncbi:3000_t:CDS:2 [Ambispora gerdemannii]|uniref:3000_t:CDS:1 n=1 Tax=Ambispora gerdemannii TaxID=144530 RepID=A0A9N8W6Y4_9GLOM|nr:3000_t:CDS:2 [Ambispora gerdemannii]
MKKNDINKDLPTRLYNITRGKDKLDIKSRKKLEVDVELTEEHPEIKRKSLTKAIKTYGQAGTTDKSKEIPKMGDYYNNSEVTLIAINAKIEEEGAKNYGAQPKQKADLSLGQALHAVAHRKRTISKDGIYSILGLLPYGKKVKVDYKPNDQAELEQVLLGVIEVAKEYDGSAEGITGSTRIKEVVSNSLEITSEGIQLIGERNYSYSTHEKKYSIAANSELIKFDFPLEISLYRGQKYSHKPINISLVGSDSINEEKFIFIDMINKQTIEGKEAVQTYKEQEIYEYYEEGHRGIQREECRGDYYVFNNNIAQRIVESEKGKDD